MRRRATAMVAVMILVVVMAALGATLMTTAGGSRRRTRQVARHVQRELALDAAFVHAFHSLKVQELDPEAPFAKLATAGGRGELAEIPYAFRLVPEPETTSVRIEASAGDPSHGRLEGYAIAYLDVEEDGDLIRLGWSLRYFGPSSPEAPDAGAR